MRTGPAQEDVYIWRIGADGKRLDDEEEVVTPGEDGNFAHSSTLAPTGSMARATARARRLPRSST